MGCPALVRVSNRAKARKGRSTNFLDKLKSAWTRVLDPVKLGLKKAKDSRAYMLASGNWATPLPGWGGYKEKAALVTQAITGGWKDQQFRDYMEIMRYANEHNISFDTYSGYHMW